ncbi:MAG: CBS domain-containing protein [Candidatus Omnitrophica bacterium]|nr:CBS domain-containing protein [Candidatus Omnitrophota bacterium]
MKVREVMSRQVTALKPEDNARQALNFLFEKEISGLPVIDAEGRLAGMFTEKEVLSYILPSYIAQVGRFIYEENPKSTRKKIMELDNIQVQQIMRKDVVTTGEDATLCEVARIMLTKKARRLPVVDASGKVVGIVARIDVVRAMAKEIE